MTRRLAAIAGVTLGVALLSPLQNLLLSNETFPGGLAWIAAADVFGCVCVAVGTRSASVGAIVASVLGGIYFLTVGTPESGPWAQMYAVIKAPIYLFTGVVGVFTEHRPMLRWLGLALPGLLSAYALMRSCI